ncbi:hypothetical protein B0H14DRAFT_3878584 [Mycena olivaceomarginata]|nr:hypothetical protein B0H14DRAFT_3878584 [Mycena olivaceomarginata]
MADYAYAFKAQHQYGYHSQAYISPSFSSSSTNPNLSTNGGNTGAGSTNNPIAPPTALLWTDLKPWMDAEPASPSLSPILLPPRHTVVVGGGNGFSSNAANAKPSGTGVNNAGYELLSFVSTEAAARALAQSVVTECKVVAEIGGDVRTGGVSPCGILIKDIVFIQRGCLAARRNRRVQAMTQSGNSKAIFVPVHLQGNSRRAGAGAGARTPITGASYSTGRATAGRAA